MHKIGHVYGAIARGIASAAAIPLIKALASIYVRIMVRTTRYGRNAWLVHDHSTHTVILCDNATAMRLGLSRRMFSIFFRKDDAMKYAREIRLRLRLIAIARLTGM